MSSIEKERIITFFFYRESDKADKRSRDEKSYENI